MLGNYGIPRRVSEKKSTNAQDKGEFSNYKADILMLNVEAVSSLVPEKNIESEQTSSMVDLFIELKNEFAAFRKGIYWKVDSFSKLICLTDDTIQNEDPRPSLQREIIETQLKYETSTYASVVQTSSAVPEDKFKVLGPVIKDKRVNTKVVINGARKNSGLKIVEFYVKLRNEQISQEIIPGSDSNHPSCLDLSTNTYLKWLSLLYQNVRGLRTKTVEHYSSVASVEYDVICVTETWLCEDVDSWHLFDDRYLVYRKDRGSSANSSKRGGDVLVSIKKCLSSRKLGVPGIDLEAIWISVKLNHRKKMLLCGVYFPPSSHVGTLFYNNVCYENDGDIANAFADYFSSVFKPSTDFDGNDECKSNCVGDLVKVESVTYDVVLAIRELKFSLTVGVDNMPSFIIKGCAEYLIYPLLVLFKMSLRTKVFPDVWKQTRIINHVFKKVLKKREGSWDGRCHFEPWSDDKDGTLAGTLSKVPHRTSGGTLGTADLLENRVSSLEPSGPETETLSLCR
ncbi:hypothetical protein AVEN_23767-1 [Araneus ventricosus]|uniref:Uncharacterized protein n=2 Tax=Araneus ventricosus TaxID=182803 RepID=A0A4Y2HMR5_ARAVE|nr:hypothetical protein AVEN_23767-1 [Araneus ventricosus]